MSLKDLDESQRKIADLLYEGFTAKEIGEKLKTKSNRVGYIMTIIYSKMKVTNKSQLLIEMGKEKLKTGGESCLRKKMKGSEK
jgi:DNA-binding NarL/FixJ family response regulator